MKVIILAGGFGTRFSELTEKIPKPMIKIGDKPIIWHVMNIYASFGYKDFYLALGYKSEEIKNYFLNYNSLNSNFTINLRTNEVSMIEKSKIDWNVTLVDTGINTLTGSRLKKMSQFIDNEPFMLTYADGVSDINIDKLLSFHHSHKKLATMTAVRPSARFGEIEFDGDTVAEFNEKPQLHDGWINGGFFVMNSEFLNFIGNENVMLEREPLIKAVSKRELMSFKHDGFWQCMDSKRDHEILEKIYSSGKVPWVKNNNK